MIVMNLEIDNIFAFQNFKINFSYPKKIVNSSIENEYLIGKPNFRYKKLNIIMGPNASGKTSLGNALAAIFNFLLNGISNWEKMIQNDKKIGKFSIDFLVSNVDLYRVTCEIDRRQKEEKINLEVYSAKIKAKDSYESCVKRLELIPFDSNDGYLKKLQALPRFGWYFELTKGNEDKVSIDDKKLDLEVLEKVLMALDSDIKSVKIIKEVKDSFVIEKNSHKIIIQEGEVIENAALSSGTKSGIVIAKILSAIIKNSNGFYYCDEKFSFIHSEIEKAILSVMISHLHEESQLFFTTHNTEILTMHLPKHSFTFLRKAPYIEAVYPQDFIKKNEVSLLNAVKNDVFNCTPNLDKIFELEDIKYEKKQ